MASNTDVESILQAAAARGDGLGGGALDRFEAACIALPGMRYPLVRVAVGASLASAAVWALRPSISFAPNGQARPWVQMVASGDEQDAGATSCPWWYFAIAGGALLGVFL